MGRPSRCPEELRREAVESCRPRIVRVVGLGSLGVLDGSPAAWARARRAAQTRRFEVDGPVRAGPVRKGERGASAGPGRSSPTPGRLFCRGDDPVTHFGVRFGIIKRTYPVKRPCEPAGCSRSGLPRWRDRPLSPPDRADGEPGRDRRCPSRVTADLPPPLCSWPAETPRPGGTAPSPVARIMAEPGRVGAWAQGTAARQTVEERRAPTSLVGTSPLMRQISAGSPASASSAASTRSPTGPGSSTLRPRRHGPLDGATPDRLRSRRQRRCGHGLGQTNPAGDLVVTPTG